MSALPHPMALGMLQSLGFVMAPRERACLARAPWVEAECARPADHWPFPHAGMWQDPSFANNWAVIAWPQA